MGSCCVVWLGFKLSPEGKGRLQMGETRRMLKHWQKPDNMTRYWNFTTTLSSTNVLSNTYSYLMP